MNQHFQNGVQRAEKEIQNKLQNVRVQIWNGSGNNLKYTENGFFVEIYYIKAADIYEAEITKKGSPGQGLEKKVEGGFYSFDEAKRGVTSIIGRWK